jgi:hypothetical protein
VENTDIGTKLVVSADGSGIVCQAGGLLLIETLRVTGLDQGLSRGLEECASQVIAINFQTVAQANDHWRS